MVSTLVCGMADTAIANANGSTSDAWYVTALEEGRFRRKVSCTSHSARTSNAERQHTSCLNKLGQAASLNAYLVVGNNRSLVFASLMRLPALPRGCVLVLSTTYYCRQLCVVPLIMYFERVHESLSGLQYHNREKNGQLKKFSDGRALEPH